MGGNGEGGGHPGRPEVIRGSLLGLFLVGGVFAVGLERDARASEPTIRVLLYEGLTYLDATGTARPALAEAWSVSSDRLTWTFTMSAGAIDSAGNPVTARRVMRSLDHVAARGPDDVVAASLDAIAGWADRMSWRAGGVAGITAPSDSQLVVRTDRPFEPLPDVLASPAFGIFVDEDTYPSTGAYRIDSLTGELCAVSDASPLPRFERMRHNLSLVP